jgi:hypothetical protein
MAEGERLNRSLRLAQQELIRVKNEYKALEMQLAHPLVRLVAKFTGKFKKASQQIV